MLVPYLQSIKFLTHLIITLVINIFNVPMVTNLIGPVNFDKFSETWKASTCDTVDYWIMASAVFKISNINIFNSNRFAFLCYVEKLYYQCSVRWEIFKFWQIYTQYFIDLNQNDALKASCWWGTLFQICQLQINEIAWPENLLGNF